ncbi:MAG: hypothetical protein ACI9XO_000522 [Paraglaciecola sp.]|jgi:uncharacterized protein YcbX
MQFKITALHTYPVKSLGGISLSTAKLTKTGLPYDRFWMLVQPDGTFITQRGFPQMAQFQVAFSETGIIVTYEDDSIAIPFKTEHQADRNLPTSIWKDTVLAQKEADSINEWFSEKLSTPLYLVRRAKKEKRFVGKHAPTEINFPDDGQILVLGEAALTHLNEKLEQPVLMNRFRPNIVFSGGTPHLEDEWTAIQIGNSRFESTKSCARCQMTTINQATSEIGQEPLKTLTTYRRWDKKIWVGRFLKLVSEMEATLSIGEEIKDTGY